MIFGKTYAQRAADKEAAHEAKVALQEPVAKMAILPTRLSDGRWVAMRKVWVLRLWYRSGNYRSTERFLTEVEAKAEAAEWHWCITD